MAFFMQNVGYEGPMGAVLEDVRQERFRQEQLRESGKFSHTCATAGANNDRCSTILGEEVGEAAKALNDGDIPGLRAELVQVAAVAVAWVERLDAEALAVQKRWDAAMAKPFAAPVFVKSATVAMREAGEAVPLATKAEIEALRAEYTGLPVVDDPDAGKEATSPAERAKIVHVWQTRVPAADLDAALQPFRSGDLLDEMIEERTAASPQFPELLAAAEARRKESKAAASLVHWSPQPGREESEAMCDQTMAAPPASDDIAEVNCPACLSIAVKIGDQASAREVRIGLQLDAMADGESSSADTGDGES